MNKSLFKVLLVLWIVVSMSLVTALSCDKVSGGKNNANNSDSGDGVGGSGGTSGGGTSGGGTGGGGTGGGATVAGCTAGTTGASICFENFDTSVAGQATDGTIQLKASGFPIAAVSADLANTDISVVKTADAAKFKKAFDLTIKVDGTAATEGLVLVGPGNLANANAFSISQGVAKGLTDYKAAGSDLKDGIVSEAATSDVNGLKAGWNILTPFMSTATSTADANASPFAFSAMTNGLDTKPILFCKTTISTITGAAAVKADTLLTGGQTATCYVGALGLDFTGQAAEDWLSTTAGDSFKKKFNIAVAGVKTDGKTIANLGLPGTDATTRVDAFKDGISTDDMTALTTANVNSYKKFAVEVVRGTFTHTPPAEATITFDFDTDVAEMIGDTIQIKASGFPTAVSADIANTDISIVKTADAAKFKKAFDITVSGGGTATGGLVLVGPGNLANASAFSIGKGVAQALTTYSDLKEGIVSEAAAGAPSANGLLPAGWNILTPFMSTSTPTSANADASPFAFTATTGGFPTKPIFFCRTTLSAITSATAVQGTTQLTGGQTATCYVGVLGENFTDRAGNDWLGATSGSTFKKKFNIAVAGVKTDATTIDNLGLIAADKVTAFKDGITAREMRQITAVNSSKYRKIAIEVVKDSGFTYTPPLPAIIKFENFDTDVAEMIGDTIQLKASGFPTAVSADIANTDISIVKTASAAKFKKAFDITVSSGGNAASGGLVLVGPGNLAGVNAFSIGKGVDQALIAYTDLKEGVVSDAATGAPSANNFLPAGWNILTSFMNSTAPTDAATAAAGASPFAFTATTGGFPTKPIFFCRTTISTITSAAAVQANTKLTGGQTATCYVGVLGSNFTGRAGNDWLNTAAGSTFKKKFNIAVAGVKTDTTTIDNLGLAGATVADKVAAFKDGISTAEMDQMTAVSSSGYKKVAIEVVRGTLPAYTLPPGTISFKNFDTDVAEMVGDTIQLKASGFPTAVSADIPNTDISIVKTAGAAKFKKAFDITVSSGGNAASGGLVLVGPGNLADANAFSIGRGVDQALTTYTDRKEGIVSDVARATGSGFLQQGWNILTPFMSTSTPTSANADASPFAFTQTAGGFPTKPVFFCRTTLSSITSATAVQGTTQLTGGQTATCYVGVLGLDFAGKAGNDWLDTAAGSTFKKKFNIAVAGVKTDATTIDNLGLLAADKVAVFKDGISQAEMRQITAVNSSGYKKVAIEVVRGTLPAYTPPPPATITFENFDTSIAEMVGDTIQLKASGFPTAVSIDVLNTDIGVIKTANAANFKRAFDVTVSSGGNAASGGLVLVGPGNLADVTSFSIGKGVNQGLNDYSAALRKEGIASDAARGSDLNGLKVGWNILSSFMNTAYPTSADADAGPFAFTETTGAFPTKPILICRTTLSAITSGAAVQGTTQLTGGQTASCYVGVLGSDFTGKAADDWLKTPSGNTFKKKFNIAVAGVKTDTTTIDNLGLAGATVADKVAAFKDGISTAEMDQITAANSSGYKKVAIEVVKDSGFTYTPPAEATISFRNFDSDVAEQLPDGTIQLKASGFPTAVSADIANTDISVIKTAGAAKFKKAFDITVSSGGNAATGGLVLVGPGNLADANVFSIGKGVDQALTAYTDRKEGIVSEAARATGSGFLQQGWNILTPFMNNAAPTDAATADADASPFAFTATTGGFPTKPIFFCRTTLSSITSSLAVQGTTQLTGGQTATCYVGVLGLDFTGKAGDDWLKTTAGNTFKKKFNIAVAGVKTDATTIANLGLTAADKVAAFKDGISQTEMRQLVAANSSKYTKVAIEVVRGTLPAYTPPSATISFRNFDTDVAEMVGDTIQLKASGFPTAVSADIANTDISIVKTAGAANFKKAFDITVSSGGNVASGGLVLVGPGNLADANDFSIGKGVAQALTAYTDRKEGIVSDAARATGSGFLQQGWNILTPFMSTSTPTSAAEADANASPFAFTATVGAFPTKPVFFCRTTLSSITSSSAVQGTTQLTGGQTATCYVGVLGEDFTGKAGNDWLNTAAGNTFKKKFNIAVAGVKTDATTIDNLGLLDADKVAAFKDGISTAEMDQMTAVNLSGYKKVAVEVVRGTLPAYTPPPPATITFENFDTSIAEMVGDTIQLKASGFPTAVSIDVLNTDIGVIKTANAANFKRAFDVTVSSGGNAASGGLVLVGPGNLADANAFSIGKGVTQGLNSYGTALLKEGIVSDAARATDLNGLKVGWNILSSFMNTAYPTSADADASPFAFTATAGDFATKPILICRTTLSSITFDGAVQATTQLTGGQRATCYVGILGLDFAGKAADDWLNTPSGNTFKKKFNIAVAGVKTDTTTLANLGLAAADKVAAFEDGISTAEMGQITAVNSSGYKKVAVEVVRGTLPIYTPPPPATIKFENFDPDVAEQLPGGTIQLKASGFGTVASDDILNADITIVKDARYTRELKRAFDVTISSGGNDATGGLVLVGPGNLADVTSFSIDKGVTQGLNDYSAASRKEGIVSAEPTYRTYALEEGWNIFTPFMNTDIPTSADADASPFAFTQTTGPLGMKPILICRTTLSAIRRHSEVQGTTQLTGGETASCYASVLGFDFINRSGNDWLDTPSGSTFKKRFNIAVAGVKTDATTIGNLGLAGADKVAAFKDGISQAEMRQLAAANSTAYTKVPIEVVRGTLPTHTPPPEAVLKFENFDTDVRLNGTTIEIKARAFPAVAAANYISSGISTVVEFSTPSGSLKRVFDIVIADKASGNTAAGGLVLVGPGNFTGITNFEEDTGIARGIGYVREGYTTSRAASNVGWSHYGVFMNDKAPTSAAEADADASPFAFTPIGGSHPFLFCSTRLSKFVSRIMVPVGATFSGGQRAYCFIASKGAAFSTQSATWLSTPASATFKKRFDIVIGGIKTDSDEYRTVIPSTDYGGSGPESGFKSRHFRVILNKYAHDFKKFSVTIVDDSAW